MKDIWKLCVDVIALVEILIGKYQQNPCRHTDLQSKLISVLFIGLGTKKPNICTDGESKKPRHRLESRGLEKPTHKSSKSIQNCTTWQDFGTELSTNSLFLKLIKIRTVQRQEITAVKKKKKTSPLGDTSSGCYFLLFLAVGTCVGCFFGVKIFLDYFLFLHSGFLETTERINRCLARVSMNWLSGKMAFRSRWLMSVLSHWMEEFFASC